MESDASEDAADASSDASEDASADTSLDVSEDVGPDAAEDASADAGEDGAMDAGEDASTDAAMDAGEDATDAGDDCHALALSGGEVPFVRVGSLPAMTGGAIREGVYRATAVSVTSAITGSYRGTWEFTGSRVDVLDQLTLSAPGPLTPESYDFTTSGITLSRTETCPDTADPLVTEYTAAGDQLLVKVGTIMFTFARD